MCGILIRHPCLAAGDRLPPDRAVSGSSKSWYTHNKALIDATARNVHDLIPECNLVTQPDIKTDRGAFEIFASFEEAEVKDRAFWLSKTPLERLAACELLRQINYGYDPATARLPRSLEIHERGDG